MSGTGLNSGRAMASGSDAAPPSFGFSVAPSASHASKLAISRFARTLSVLLASGVSILDALDIVKQVVGNRVVADAVQRVKESVGHGASIANPVRRSVEEGLLHVAESYDSEVEATVGALTSLLEPLMILIMGLVVGFMVLAILLPIFDINQAIR